MTKAKQNNKKHKDSRKEGSLNVKNPIPKLTKKKTTDLSKDLRVLKASQRKQMSIKKISDSDYSQRGNNNSAPLLCGVFPLFDFNDTEVLFSLLKRTDPDAKIINLENMEGMGEGQRNSFTMHSKKLRKNFEFTSCKNFRDRFDYLDLAKVVDWAIFVLPNDFDELIGDYTEDLLSSLIAQGLPSSVFCRISDIECKKKMLEKTFENITKLSLGDTKIFPLTNGNDASKLMRHLAESCKPSFISTSKSNISSKSLHKKKGYFIVEHLQYDNENDRVTVRGCMRGYGMNLEKALKVHLTEVGDFQVNGVKWLSPEDSNKSKQNTDVKSWTAQEQPITDVSIEMGDGELNIDDNDNDSSNNEDMDDDSSSIEEEISDIGSEDSEDANDDKMSFASTAHTGYSMAQIQKFRDSHEDSKFPDEIELDCTELARDRLAKYRGLQGFRESVWPIDEHNPVGYNKVFQFKNYKHIRNRICNNMTKLNRTTNDNFISAGSKFEMTMDKFTEESRLKITEIFRRNPKRHLICSNLLMCEDLMSVVHFNERRLSSVDDSAVEKFADCKPNTDMTSFQLGEDSTTGSVIDPNLVLAQKAEPIESKETMYFQVGFRRFIGTPIYSEFTANCDTPGSDGKSKYLKFMEPKKNVVATLYGPVTYGPVPVLQFRMRMKDLGFEETGPPYIAELVATGSLLSVDPSRPIIKRILLSGQIFKVNKRSVMSRFMFFNVEDIEHYKDVPLHTKNGRKGRIDKSSGTHGYMKCIFDKPLVQDQVVLMPLYKRVFPKNTSQNLYDLLPDSEQIESEVMDTANFYDPMDEMY